ncbi:unnamed protein product [Polarella glacialis]|uniref:Uncharacterized protein n=2 Tax=Polarella glacialis TaxID=89957 RepID=A0A813GW63_POLGL|nr:unnamed protein product [Polarella glacialis]
MASSSQQGARKKCYDWAALFRAEQEWVEASPGLPKKAKVAAEPFCSDRVEIKTSSSGSGSRGRGLVLSAPVAEGELLFVCPAFVLAPRAELEAAVLERLRTCQEADYNRFFCLQEGPAGRAEIPEAIAFWGHTADAASSRSRKVDPERVRQVLRVNSIARDVLDEHGSAGEAALSGVWIQPSLMNHSCRPNVQQSFLGDLLVARAARPLAAGEELLIAYVSTLQPLHLRRDRLQEIFGFECRCPRCLLESVLLPLQIAKPILERLDAVVRDAASQKLPELASQLLDLAEQASREASKAASSGIDRIGGDEVLREASRQLQAAHSQADADLGLLERLLRGSFLAVFMGAAFASKRLGTQTSAAAYGRCVELLAEVCPASAYHAHWSLEWALQVHREDAGSAKCAAGKALRWCRACHGDDPAVFRLLALRAGWSEDLIRLAESAPEPPQEILSRPEPERPAPSSASAWQYSLEEGDGGLTLSIALPEGLSPADVELDVAALRVSVACASEASSTGGLTVTLPRKVNAAAAAPAKYKRKGNRLLLELQFHDGLLYASYSANARFLLTWEGNLRLCADMSPATDLHVHAPRLNCNCIPVFALSLDRYFPGTRLRILTAFRPNFIRPGATAEAIMPCDQMLEQIRSDQSMFISLLRCGNSCMEIHHTRTSWACDPAWDRWTPPSDRAGRMSAGPSGERRKAQSPPFFWDAARRDEMRCWLLLLSLVLSKVFDAKSAEVAALRGRALRFARLARGRWRLQTGAETSASLGLELRFSFDRVFVSAACGALEPLRWEFELREDVVPEESRAERLAVLGDSGLLLMLRKRVAHRWDRLLMEESSGVTKDWKREDKNLPDEDEVELPRAQNLRRLTAQQLREDVTVRERTVVVAMRYPWCTVCTEKDKAYVKVSKVVGGKEAFSKVVFATLDLREEKSMARQFWHSDSHPCHKDRCPFHVFKPDEPFDEPYAVGVHLLYEMDEMAMMTDPMAGAPGHQPKGQTAKPNFERFEQDLALLLPPALVHVSTAEEAAEFRQRWDTSVLAVGVNSTVFRRAARGLRGKASFAFAEDASALSSEQAASGQPTVELWSKELAADRRPLLYDGSLAPLSQSQLQSFVRVHSMPLIQNYTYDLKDKLDGLGLPVAVLWVNHSDTNNSNTTQRAMTAFRSLCETRRGTNASQHVLCCLMDQSYSYYQRDYGTHEPYPFPFFGLTKKLGFGEGDRFGYPFKEPANKTVHQFFGGPKRAAKDMSAWIGRVLAGRIPPSHESGVMPNRSKWARGEVLEVVWKTFQQDINGSTADILLELYDNQRKKTSILTATMDVIALTLKDYSNMKVARMEVSQNFVPHIFGRKQYSKDTEYYWIPPSMENGELTPMVPVKFSGAAEEATPKKLLSFLKKHSISSWSLKEALEASEDLSEEILGRARIEQREDDRADEDKQAMIKKMMTTLKKEKGLVDVGEMMNLKKAADTLGEKPEEKKASAGKGGKKSSQTTSTPEETEKKLAERRKKLKREEEKDKENTRKEKEKRKKRKEADKLRDEKKKAEKAEVEARERKAREERKRKLDEERARLPFTALFSWGQSKEQIRMTVSIPLLLSDTLNVSITSDRVGIRALDGRNRTYILEFELREFVVPDNSSWSLKYSEANPLDPSPDGVLLLLTKETLHRWDRLAQDHVAVKQFMKHDWVQDDGELEDEKEDVELPSGPNLKKVTAEALHRLLNSSTSMAVVAPRFPWCDKCKEKDKHFEKAARYSKGKEHLDAVLFTTLDVREDKYFAKRHNITCSEECELMIFKKDEPDEPYVVPGRRFSEEIQIDCYKHLLPAVSVVVDKDQLDRVTSAFDTAMVGFFKGSKGEDAWYSRFRAVARQLRGHALFGAVFDGKTPRDLGIDRDAAPALRLTAPPDSEAAASDRPAPEGTERPLILLFKPKENRHVEFTGELTLENLARFSKVLSVPLISQYSFESRQKYQELKVPLGMLWLDGDDEDREENRVAKEVLTRLAHRFSGHLVFVTLNNTRDAMLMRPMALDPRRVPAFGISATDEADALRFGFDLQAKTREEFNGFWGNQELSYARLESFCASFLEGTLEASHESAELSPSYVWPGPGYVHEVVWKTFRDSVYRCDHDVLLELYSPFRPQHRTYGTVLELVAEALENVTGLKIARMDTANNYVLPEFGVSDKEKASTIVFLPAAPERHRKIRRFAGKVNGRAEDLPERLLRFVHRETRGQSDWDLAEQVAWAKQEAQKRIRRLKLLEKDYEKKMQEEWMQKEMEEFERYKKLGKFDNMNL